MRKAAICLLSLIALLAVFPVHAGLLDDFLKGSGGTTPASGPSNEEAVSGLKEALSIGTGNAVGFVSAKDGYFSNQAIKILMPEKMQKVADVLGKVGYQKQVDEFVLSMNHAAEKAAPKAKSIFVSAIKEMTFDDARKILGGGDTAATEFFKAKTSDKLYAEFKPIVSTSMDNVGTTRRYKDMMKKYNSVPFARSESLDLDHHVTNKALDGLFYMIGQEEKKIRTDPAARVTDLLKAVFGKK